MAMTMDVFAPKNPKGKGVIWIISSSGRSSRDKIRDNDFTEFLAHGYCVFAVLHSSEPRFNLQDMVSDVHRAVRYVRFHAEDYLIDEERLGIVGSSSGGTLALMVGLNGDAGNQVSDDPVQRTSNKVRAVACFFSPTDWCNFGEKGVNAMDYQVERYGRIGPSFTFYEHQKDVDMYQPIQDRERALALLKEFSPITHVGKDDPPTLIIHGDSDRIIPFQQGESLYKKMKETGVVTQLIRRKGKGHGWKGWRANISLVVDWFDEHL
jgi:acetyl esterase/lipase